MNKIISLIVVTIIVILMLLGIQLMENLKWSGTSIFIGSFIELFFIIFILILIFDKDGELFK